MIKKYIEIYISVKREDSEFLTYELHDISPLGVEIIDSRDVEKLLLNLKNDEISDLTFEDSEYVFLKSYLSIDDEYMEKLKEVEELKKKLNFEYETREVENDWSKEWMKFYSPIEVGENILILPNWMDRESDRIKIYINPSMAFGTGYHETTRLVLSQIEKLDIEGKKALDIGCGSGILSILLRKLKAKEVDAVDIDDNAIEQSKENISYNNVDKINVYKSNLFENIEGKFDIICGNLLAEIIVDMLDYVDEYLSEGGNLILSGIIEESEYKVLDKLKEKSYKTIERKKEGDWIMLSCKREKDV